MKTVGKKGDTNYAIWIYNLKKIGA